MAEVMTIEIQGMDQLRRQFSDLSDRVQSRVIGTALKRAVIPIQLAAKPRVPVRTGRGKRNIVTKAKSSRKAGYGLVGFRKTGDKRNRNNAYYLTFVERGTVHMGARPFLEPAYEQHKDQVLNVFVEELNAAITKAAAKK